MKFYQASMLVLLTLVILWHAAPGGQTQRDHLTGMEADLIREAQSIDKRTDVFARAIERRILVLTDPQGAAETKQVKKELEKWGPLPSGSRYELFSDIAKILDEAITNIDDSSNRSGSNELLAKALRKLSGASSLYMSQLQPLQASSRGPEREALARVFEHTTAIIEAAKKMPPPATKK